MVIDASVARAAGGKNAVWPLSKECRDFLINTLDVGHRAVLSPAVREEWKKHESSFSRQWRTMMMARKKLVLREVGEDRHLRAGLEQCTSNQRHLDAMMKDVHLLEAAHATDNTVISLDDIVRDLFGVAALRVPVLREVVWVNPGKESAIAWLRRGAPREKQRLLGTSRKAK